MKVFSIAASAMVCFLSLWATPSSAYEPATIYNYSPNEYVVYVNYGGCDKADKWHVPGGKIWNVHKTIIDPSDSDVPRKITIERTGIVPSVSHAPTTKTGNIVIILR